MALDPTVKSKQKFPVAANADDNAEKTVAEKLLAALQANYARVLDLFRQMDENGDGEISRTEFVTAFQEEDNLMQGLDVPTSACGALFDEWDADSSGTITFDELRKVLRKRPAAQPRPRRARPGGRRGRSQKQRAAEPDEMASSTVELVNPSRRRVGEDEEPVDGAVTV